ncbi:MAG TPA: glycosyltransferase [Candidatus Binatia bacterium]|nr:glycosyltransferase [Candidatus Binatia bacterium]
MPSVSIVILTRNRPEHLPHAIRSAGAQTHAELELVLVRDGGSPLDPESRAAIEDLEFPALLVERDGPPEGVARSRNEGIGSARGDAVAILDDDDLWDPPHVAHLAALLDRDPQVDVAYSDARIRLEDGGGERVIAREFDLAVFSQDDYVPPSTMLIRRSAFERFGVFDPDFTCSEDWDWLLRVVKRGGTVARSPGVTATVLIHAAAHSALQLARLEERKRCLELLSRRHGLPPLTPKTYWEVAETVCPGSGRP